MVYFIKVFCVNYYDLYFIVGVCILLLWKVRKVFNNLSFVFFMCINVCVDFDVYRI